MPDDIRSLVERLQAGDSEAFEQIVLRYSNFVFSTAYGVLRNVEDAREITQEVFLKLLEKGASLRRPEAFVSYLRITTRNAAVDRYRRSRNMNVSLDAIGEVNVEADTPDPGDEMMSHERDESLKGKVAAAIAELPEDQQEVVRLRYESRLSYIEIAQKLECGLNVVRGRLYRAHKSLEGLLSSLREGER